MSFFNLWKSGKYCQAVEHIKYNRCEFSIDEWLSCKQGRGVQLASSGSFSYNRFYYFGPMEGVLAVERLLKGFPLTMLQMYDGPNEFQTIKNLKYDSLFAFNVDNPDFSLLWKKKPVNLCAAPNVWLFLSKDKYFFSELDVRSISTTGWDMFFDSSLFPVLVNDNMLNLKTGDGFFDCGYNTHCLPFKLNIGGKVANLMNLADKILYENDDLIEFEYKRLSVWNEVTCLYFERLSH